MSEIEERFAEAVAAIGGVLKRHGFRKKRSVWTRVGDGIVHEIDVLRGLQDGNVTLDSPVKQIAHPIGGLIYPKARIEELFRIFETDQVGVVVENGRIVGIVSKIDVLDFMSRRGK